jgi:hypothetical protein
MVHSSKAPPKKASSSAASHVTWLGLSAAWWLGKKAGSLALAWVVASGKWAMNLIRWPQSHMDIVDTQRNGLKVLQAVASWGMTHNYLTRADYKNAQSLQDFAQLIHTKVLPHLSTGKIPLRFINQGDINAFWVDCLNSHAIPHVVA